LAVAIKKTSNLNPGKGGLPDIDKVSFLKNLPSSSALITVF